MRIKATLRTTKEGSYFYIDSEDIRQELRDILSGKDLIKERMLEIQKELSILKTYKVCPLSKLQLLTSEFIKLLGKL